MGGLTDQVTNLNLIEATGCLVGRIIINALTIRLRKPTLFSTNLKLGNRKWVSFALNKAAIRRLDPRI